MKKKKIIQTVSLRLWHFVIKEAHVKMVSQPVMIWVTFFHLFQEYTAHCNRDMAIFLTQYNISR